jgi:hypothetical protein
MLWRQLEHRAAATCAIRRGTALRRGTIEVSGAINDKAGERVFAINSVK